MSPIARCAFCSMLPLLAACDQDAPSLSEEELQQVIEQWSAEPPPEPAPHEGALQDAEGDAIPLPPMAPSPEQLSDKFLVILHSSKESGSMPASLQVLAQHPELMDDVFRISSSWFQGLMPCYEVTLVGAFEHRRQATTLARQLEVLGVDNYVKQAGRYVGTQEVVEAWCEADHGAQTASCGDTRFVEVHDGAAWLWLPQDPVVIERALEGAPAPTPLGGLTAWSSPLTAETIDPYRKGAAWKVFAPVSARSLGSCKIERFAAITRGQPHFGYLSQEPPPTAPGCGSPEVFARLSCKEPPAEPLIALPPDAPDPVLYTALAPLRDIELEDDAKILVSRSPAFTPVFREARAQAEARAMPLQQLVTLRGFVAPGRKVLLVQVTLQTGDGVVWCGNDDVREDLAGLFEWNPDGGIGAEIVPFRALDGAGILGLIDLDADGTPEMLERVWPNELRLWRAGQEQSCTVPQDYCDCPC